MRSSWYRAALGLTLGFACADAAGVPPEPVSETSSALPPCESSACSALAGPCQEGACDPRTGACRIVAAREGEPCLEGNVCGSALCRNGECTALDPSRCPTVDNEQCRVAVCRPEQGGCVSGPAAVPGATCETAVPLPAAGVSALSASTQCGDHARQFPGCTSGLLGPSSHFALDLRGATGPTSVAIAIDADFSFEAVLTRGPCGDSVLEACATPLQADRRSRGLFASLSPAYYELVVTGSGESDQGTVHVAASVGPATCSGPPTNDKCDGGLAFAPSLGTQTIIGNDSCGALSQPTRCGVEPIGDVFYDLDLSQRTAPTLLEVDVARFDETRSLVFAVLFSAAEPGCGEFAMCGTRFTGRLRPGRYRVGVSQAADDRFAGEDSISGDAGAAVAGAPPPSPFALRVRLRDADCAAVTNDTWQTAIDLDPYAEKQHIAGDTACGNDDFSAACNADRGAPELFYRLDLRGQPGPRRFYFSGPTDSDLVAYLLLPDAAGVPSRVVGCQALSSPVSYSTTWSSAGFTLAPRLYYFVIDGRVANAGRFDLEVFPSEPYPVPRNCYDYYLLLCVDESEPACADSRASPDCLRAGVECGLDPAVYEAFCASFPGCCDGTADLTECHTAWSANLECN